MNMHHWQVKNGEGKIIKDIYTGSRSRKIASDKVRARLGKNACFAYLDYVGQVPMKLETLAGSLTNNS